MSATLATAPAMRVKQAEVNLLAWAFGISLAVHLLAWGTWYSGHRLGWWENWRWPRWMESSRLIAKILPKAPLATPSPPAQEIPLVFVSVSEAQATPDAPEKAAFYSSKNSKAANTQADRETGIPKIEGTQTEVAKTEDVPRKEYHPLQPARAQEAQPAPEAQEEEKARPIPTPGDLTLAKPDATPDIKPDSGKEARTRPRTIKEAMARRLESQIPGQKMKQEGGVRRHLDISSLDAKATPFGAYDSVLVEAVTQRWYSLLDQRAYASDSRGKVVLQFTLHQNGRISEMRVGDNTAGEVLGLICQKAVLDPAPFAAWPPEMRRILGETRNIQFTFYYH